MIEVVHSEDAPRPNGHYSQAVVYNGVLYMSVQLPIDPATGAIASSLEGQAAQLFQNCKSILSAGESSFQDILSATIYVTDIDDWPLMDSFFAKNVGDYRPARGMVKVSELHLGAKVALQLTAVCRK